MATTKLFLDMRGKAKDGKGSVQIALNHNRTSVTIPTGYRIAPSNWKNEKVVHMPDAQTINAALQKIKLAIDTKLFDMRFAEDISAMTAQDLKVAIADPNKRRGIVYLKKVFEEYIEGGMLKEGTKKIYHSAWLRVQAYSGERTRLESVNLKYLRGFEQFLSETQTTNGRSIYLRCLRAVCNYARHNGMMRDYPFDTFSIKSEPTRKRSLSIEQLREFMKCPTTELNVMYRDYFFLSFYLIGINIKDLLLARKSQVVDGRLEYVREKTGKRYSVLIEPEAWEIIKRHEGAGEYLLDAMDHCKRHYHFARQINEAIATIGPMKESRTVNGKRIMRPDPLLPDITTYFARHSWATIAYETGIPMDIISQAMGHSFGNRTTMIYIKPDPSKVDKANRQVIDRLLDINGHE